MYISVFEYNGLYDVTFVYNCLKIAKFEIKLIIVYYIMRSKNEVLCAAAGRLAAERSKADKPAKAHKTIFAPNNIYYFFFKTS
jgi:hypothetical protein